MFITGAHTLASRPIVCTPFLPRDPRTGAASEKGDYVAQTRTTACRSDPALVITAWCRSLSPYRKGSQGANVLIDAHPTW